MSDPAPRFTGTELLLIGLGVLGLVGTWAQGFHYLSHGLVAGNVLFWRETVATPASTFLVVDILVLAAGVFVLMFAEGRRLGIASGESACSGRPNRSNRRAPTGWPSGSPSRSWWCPWATASGTFPGA